MPRKQKERDMTFARNLTRLMTEHRVGVRDFANRCDCAPSNITEYRNGVAPSDFKLIARMASELGVSMSFLLTGKEDKKSNTKPATVTEVFDDGGQLYDGYARITIQRLIPRSHVDSPNNPEDRDDE